jgi:hypothetical protein
MISLTRIEGSYCLYRFTPGTRLPRSVEASPFYSLTASAHELSLVAPDGMDLACQRSDPGWALFRVNGPLDSSLVGVLAGLTGALAEVQVPVFAISTFDTDYLLVKNERAREARAALQRHGFRFHRSDPKPSDRPLTVKDLLRKQVPVVRALLQERIGSAVSATLKSDEAWAATFGSLYEFLPVAVRLMLTREAFVSFFVRNRKLVLPPVLRPSDGQTPGRPRTEQRTKPARAKTTRGRSG